MRWLIRRVLKKGKGAVSYEEDVHYGDVLSIGRAADQAIFLSDMRAALNHAQVTLLTGGQYKVESLIVAGIRVNNEISYSTSVGANTTIEIGNTRITLLEPPKDFDAAVDVSILDKGEQSAEKEKRAKPVTLTQTWLGKRKPSWILFFAVLVFGLVLPMFGHFYPGLGELLRRSPLPSTASWNPGTIDAAHHFFAADCTVCHKSAFLTVRDKECLACHAKVAAHADPVKFNVPELGNAACRTCHQDHNGLRGLIRTDQRLCADCHGDVKTRTKGASALIDVTDFGKAHPQFMVNLPAWDSQGKFAPQRTTWTADLKENSGLKFTHVKHLQEKGLNTPNGHRNLVCADCHVADAGGANFKPVNFEAMCHECHTLGFDTLSPERQVPHGKVPEVVYMLDEHYAKLGLEGGYQDAKAPTIVQERRRPGQPPMSRQEQVEALAWARDKTRQVAESLFTGRACTTCHKVTPPRNPGDTWQIAPVRVAGIWYAKAKFTHEKHTTLDCTKCHDAERSSVSSDLLIPDISNCQKCHAGAYTKDKVATTCIACHDYHQSKTLLQGKL